PPPLSLSSPIRVSIALHTSSCPSLSLHDALPISDPIAFRAEHEQRSMVCDRQRPVEPQREVHQCARRFGVQVMDRSLQLHWALRSEEHTSELQSPDHLVCSLLLELKNSNTILCCH